MPIGYRINGSLVPRYCAAFDEDATAPGICPASEWQAIATFIRTSDNSIPRSASVIGNQIVFPSAAELTGNVASRQFELITNLADDPLNGTIDSIEVQVSTTQQSAIADALVNTAAIWSFAALTANFFSHGVSAYDQQNAEHWIHTDYYQPYSMANCIRDTINDSNDTRPVSFPVVPTIGYNPVRSEFRNLTHYIEGVPVLDYPPILRAQLSTLHDSELDFPTTWVELPPSYFNISSLGAIVMLPSQYSSSPDKTGQDFVVCNLGAGWGASSVNVTYHEATISATSSLVNSAALLEIVGKSGLSENTTDRTQAANWFQQITDVPIAFGPPFFPETIEITKEWAEYLNPQIPSLNTTVIDFMLKSITGNRTVHFPERPVQWMLGALLTNGLARIGYDYKFQGNPRLRNDSNGIPELDGTYWLSGKGEFFTVDPDESRDWVKLRVDSTIEGYAYNARGVGPKVAIAFLLTYCAIALTFILYTVISGSYLNLLFTASLKTNTLTPHPGNTSTAWDSISEVTALAMNSSRTKHLQNTCGGISELQTFKTLVRVMVRRNDEGGDAEHLEMVFGDDGHLGENGRDTLQVNRAYGAVPPSLFPREPRSFSEL